MPCGCGEVTCICFYICNCQPQSCVCRTCMVLQQSRQAVIGSPNKQNYGENQSQPSKISAQRDSSNEQICLLVNDSTPKQRQVEQYAASVSNQGKQALSSTSVPKEPKDTASSSNENKNRNFGLTNPTSRNSDTRQTSADLSGRCKDNSLNLGSAPSCNNAGSQSLHSPDRVPRQANHQEPPSNRCSSTNQKIAISVLDAMDLFGLQEMKLLKVQRDFSNTHRERDMQFSSDESEQEFSTEQESTAQGSPPETRSESTAMTLDEVYEDLDAFHAHKRYNIYTTKKRYESLEEPLGVLKNFDQILVGPISDPSSSGYFIPLPTSQALASNTHCTDVNEFGQCTFGHKFFPHLEKLLDEISFYNTQSTSADLNKFSETPENPDLEREEFSSSDDEIPPYELPTAIRYQWSRLPSQSTFTFSAFCRNDPVDTPNEAQSHQSGSSNFPPSMDQSEDKLLASRSANEAQIPPQASASFQPQTSGVNMSPVSKSMETHDIIQENLPHHSQSSSSQRSSSGTSPSRLIAHYKDDDPCENS